MAASSRGFGVLKPLQRNKGNQPLQPPSEQPYYSQFALQIDPHPPRPPPSVPPPQQQQQQTANYAPNGSIHAQFQSQPQSPALNGHPAGPPTPRHSQVTAPVSAATLTGASPAVPATTSTPTRTAPPAPPSTTDAPASQSRHRTVSGRPHKRRRSGGDNQVEPVTTAAAPASPTVPAVPRVPPRPPAPHPFNRGPYNTLQDAIFSLQLHVFTSGYGVSQKRTVKEKLASGKYDPNGDVIRKDFACDKGGNEFVSHSRGERRRWSKKCGCPWKAAIRRLQREGGRWFIEILDNQHNHAVTSPDEMHTLASYRRWQRENNAGVRSAIACLTRAAAMPARDIAAYLRGEVEDDDLARIDTQILRALSMCDKELPSGEREGGPIVFDMLARRPVIILQGNDKTFPPGIANGDSGTIPKVAPPAPMDDDNNTTLLHGTRTPTTTSTTVHDSPVNPRQTVPNNFANDSHNPQTSPPLATGADV
ncbi:hypothetical protein F5Y08DRAFT_331714 [Xylaria arbuscula]|nr:hypothetical protein F5Y08DRAFT_331714 [Xylaria arbuscula]